MDVNGPEKSELQKLDDDIENMANWYDKENIIKHTDIYKKTYKL